MTENINGTNSTYVQLINIFEQIAINHAQINYFNEGDLADFNAKTVTNYPILWAMVKPTKITPNTLNVVVNVTIADLVSPDLHNQREVESDTLSVLWDIVFLLRDTYDIEIQFDVTANPFTEYKDDRVAGWNADLTLIVPRTFGNCDAPVKGC